MNLRANGYLLKALCVCVFSVGGITSLTARPYVSKEEPSQNQHPTLDQALQQLNAHISATKDAKAVKALNKLYGRCTGLKKSKDKDVQETIRLIDEAGSYKVPSKLLWDLKRELCKSYALMTKNAASDKDCTGSSCGPTCGTVTPINQVPVTITQSGKYCISRDLTYTGSGAAITIAASNVTINFENQSLYLTNPSAIGVFACNCDEITIQNDKIVTNSVSSITTSAAIYFNGVHKGTIDNVFTQNTFRGINLENCVDVAVTNTHHKDHIGSTEQISSAAIRVAGSSGVKIDSTVIEGNTGVNSIATTGVIFSGASQNCSVTNSHIVESDLGISALQIDGLLIEDCLVSSSPTTYYNAINLGYTDTSANDVIIRNTTVVNRAATPTYDGLFLGTGSGLLLENVLVDVNTTSAEDYFPAAIRVGVAGETTMDNVIIRNTIVNNVNEVALLIDKSSNCLVDGCQFSKSTQANIRLNCALQCTVKDCVSSLSNPGIGIDLTANSHRTSLIGNQVKYNLTGINIGAGSLNNSLQDNQVVENAGVGVAIGAGSNNNSLHNNKVFANQSSGIVIAAGSQSNSLQDNQIHSNSGDGISIGVGANSNNVHNNRVYANSGKGIVLADTCSHNSLQKNSVYSNTGIGIDNGSNLDNELFFNTSCNNTADDCSGSTFLFQQQSPGSSPVVVGSNICCDIPIPPPAQ